MNPSSAARHWWSCREPRAALSAFLLLQASISTSLTPIVSAQQKNANTKTSSTEDYTDAEAYQIYSALLDTQTDSYFVIEAKTFFFEKSAPDNLGIKGNSHFRKLWGPLLRDFAAKERTPMSLTESIPIKASYVLVSGETLSSIFKADNGWDAFSERYPHAHGVYSFSPVGFDRGKTHAMVWMQFACGQLCGHGTYHFFEKSEGKWREVIVKAVIMELVS
jgi:hypothetical protein